MFSLTHPCNHDEHGRNTEIVVYIKSKLLSLNPTLLIPCLLESSLIFPLDIPHQREITELSSVLRALSLCAASAH